jgi:hypothetical protein
MLSEDYYGSEDIEREYVYGNNIRVIGLTDEFNSGDVSTVVIYIPSLDYTFFLGLYDAEIIQIMTEEY